MIRVPAALLSLTLAMPAAAQQSGPADCSIPANAELPECLSLPDTQQVTNFIPFLAPLLAAGAVGAIASANGGFGRNRRGPPNTTNRPN